MSTLHLYGIKNCGSVRKAIAWLEERQIPFQFHDFKTEGVGRDKLLEWEESRGWETLLNRRGTTWRTLDPNARERIVDAETAIELMSDLPTLIKRPVIEAAQEVLVGYDEELYEKTLT